MDSVGSRPGFPLCEGRCGRRRNVNDLGQCGRIWHSHLNGIHPAARKVEEERGGDHHQSESRERDAEQDACAPVFAAAGKGSLPRRGKRRRKALIRLPQFPKELLDFLLFPRLIH